MTGWSRLAFARFSQPFRTKGLRLGGISIQVGAFIVVVVGGAVVRGCVSAGQSFSGFGVRTVRPPEQTGARGPNVLR